MAPEPPKTETAPGIDIAVATGALLDAALLHVPFDGWSDATFRAAARDAGLEIGLAKVICPRGAVDLAVAYHRRGDAAMRAAMAAADAVPATDEAPRPGIRARIGAAIMARLAAADREVVRRGAALFALPQHAATGSKLVWETADAVWTALGDSSDDLNWYTKRATLAAVYSATVLYWLGDTSEGDSATQEFLDRRLDDVMRIEKLKAQVRDNRLLSGLMAGPAWLAGRIRPPQRTTPAPAPENVQGDI